ncbi:exportin-5-like [Misgurnus anguillicaudatus]|uniref:exportin-5-like n=1 Tax=Misgurnus anguillicaudatus TaxID=75329 RepID=UPI003CCF7542
MSLHEKVQLKNCTMGLVSNGVHPILEEECHIKDSRSRIVVEMIKREWPQQWPEMLTEMVELTALGARNAHNPDNRQKVAKFMSVVREGVGGGGGVAV